MIVSFSNSSEFLKRYPEYKNIKDEKELFCLDSFTLLLDLSIIKENQEYFFDLTKELSACKGIFCLSSSPNFSEGTYLLSLGIKGYGNIHMAKSNLRDALNAIQKGSIWLYPEFLQMMITSFSKNLHTVNMKELDRLSKREQEIASLVKEGLSNKEIAKHSNITERTVKAHLSSIYEKLKVKDRVSLVIKLSTNVQ